MLLELFMHDWSFPIPKASIYYVWTDSNIQGFLTYIVWECPILNLLPFVCRAFSIYQRVEMLNITNISGEIPAFLPSFDVTENCYWREKCCLHGNEAVQLGKCQYFVGTYMSAYKARQKRIIRTFTVARISDLTYSLPCYRDLQ